MANSEVIKERLKEIKENLIFLDGIKNVPQEEFVSDIKLLKSCERCLQISIQCLLDIAHYLIAQNKWPRVHENKEAIHSLASHGVIPQSFAKKVEPMAGLRNLLVHEYIKIDPVLIYSHLQNLEDFREFCRYILKYIQE